MESVISCPEHDVKRLRPCDVKNEKSHVASRASLGGQKGVDVMSLADMAGIALVVLVVGTVLTSLAILGCRISVRIKIPKIFSISVHIRNNR